jgi:hypothetical protein
VTEQKLDFPALYLELVDSTGMIRALLAGLTQEEVQVKPDANSWSVLETLGHLYEEERLDFRARLAAILQDPDKEWEPIHPDAWVRSHNYNEQDFDEAKGRFFGERSKSLDWLKGIEKSDWNVSHTSEFGTFKAGDLLASWIAHDNLAIRQLVELRRARLERITRPYDITYAGDW